MNRNEFGGVEKYKARLVVLGYRQKKGVDYTGIYAPVANMNSIRVYLSACCHQGFHIQQYHVEPALLNGHLDEEVYIYPPRGVQVQANKVCLLKRSLYGLKQAAATWFKTISQVFLEMGFRHCRTDSCIFFRQRGNSVVYIVLYVDDMSIGAKTLEEIKAISDKLSRKFKLKYLGKVKFMLGIQLDYDREQRSMKICQTSSINKIVEKFNQVDAKLAKSGKDCEGFEIAKGAYLESNLFSRLDHLQMGVEDRELVGRNVVHGDVVLLMPVKSQGGAKQLIRVTDVFSGLTMPISLRPSVKFSFYLPNSKHLSKIHLEKRTSACVRKMVMNEYNNDKQPKLRQNHESIMKPPSDNHQTGRDP
uniref:Putative polyprotein n=1 Tax=Albugo laibachii Nc14 TaxID=890382 RepID=F0W3P3_9STRA|nr:putative polyprotein [Albugo laibachii Nc14]|eukprot:CCA15713.1 putative polyprotein [Albugo laibachii Nc14]